MAGLLFQTMRKLGLPVEDLENINMTLTGFAQGALVQFGQGSLELPGRIRVFCQQKMIDAANAAQTSRFYNAQQVMEHAQIIPHSVTKMNGGWGYFLIKRGGIVSDDASLSSRDFVDLYLYREG